ncbi:hypothetical protein NFI96_000198 [Prochilodus magdalenae]|nr:hypothetical protein NFI96_000198 [Prochilodus magdalenae]
MSTVQFSSSSSVLGTLASSRTFPPVRRDTPPHARVCRSLFGPVDHEELNREMKAKLHEIAERDQRRWNFNFGAGVPLLGEYEWEEAPRETSPAFYQECVRVGRKGAERASQTSAELPRLEEDCTNCGHVSDREQREDLPLIKPEEKSPGSSSGKRTCKRSVLKRKRPSPLTTTRITDFYVKRRNSVGVNQSSSPKSFPSAAEEQTPRKRLR